MEGVIGAVITLFTFDAGDGAVYDVLQPDLNRWLGMDAHTLDITVEAEEA